MTGRACRFGDGPAVGLFRLPGGCVVFPGDREQALCAHHALKATPLAGIMLVEDWTVDEAFARLWTRAERPA